MKVEILHDGKKCKRFKINGKNYGEGITDVNIKISGWEKPEVEIVGRSKNLNIILNDCKIKTKAIDKMDINASRVPFR